MSQTQPGREWTRVDEMAFEQALAIFPENDPNLWEKMAIHVSGGWSPEDMKERYQILKKDVFLIESGLAELPRYSDDVDVEVAAAEEVHPPPPVPSNIKTASTEEEHGTSSEVTIGESNHRLSRYSSSRC